MVTKKTLSGCIIGSMLVFLTMGQFAAGQNDQIQYKRTAGLVEITTPELAVKVTSNGSVPHFHFWKPSEKDSMHYHIKFLRLFEVNDINGDEKYDKGEDILIGSPLLLPSINWDLSEFTIEEGPDSEGVQAVHFNFTHSLSSDWGVPGVNIYIQIRVHLYATELNEMKFDLLISGWDWQLMDSLLVLQFTVSGSSNEEDPNDDDPIPMVQDNNQFQFEEGFMEYAEQAQSGKNNIQVYGTHNNGLEAGDKGASIYLAFTNFGDETLEYDPTIGILSGIKTPQITSMWIIVIPIILILIPLIIVISKEEYFDFIKKKIAFIESSNHRLTLNEVLENKNRKRIIDEILQNPGIHFNELLRKTNLSPGNLYWHLDILESYKIIGKKRFENFVVFFPYYQKNPISNLDLKLRKSELTLNILKLIEKKPGIWNSIISKKLKINRKTIQYHITKLVDLGVIYTKKTGSKMKLFLKSDSDYFNNNNN
jgi:predicted transcriptional regulator